MPRRPVVSPHALVLLAAVSVGCSQQRPSDEAPSRSASSLEAIATTRWIVELDEAPTGVARTRARTLGLPFDEAAYSQRLVAGQERVLASLIDGGIAAALASATATAADATTTVAPLRWTFAFNGFAVDAPSSSRAAIASTPGVRAVHENAEVKALLAESVPYTGATQAWSEYQVKGEGQVVADIDTGIDWAHPSFTDNPALPPGELHPKVKYYISYTAGLVTDDFGHGTHVGATIAGDRALGYSTGTFSELGDLGASLFDGMAPHADLWGYKVLSTAGSGLTQSIVLAIDDSAARGASIQNLSLGSSNDDPESANSVAVNNAMKAGTVSVVAAGNDGPGYSTIGTPATAHLALTVGASTDPGDNQYFAHDTTSGRKMVLTLFSNSPVPPTPAIESLYVHAGEGCTPADYAARASVIGKIALIARGTCTFTVKAVLAQEQGAAAALIYNNLPGDYTGSMEQTRIMVGALSDVNGQYLVGFTGADGLSTHQVLLDPAAEVQSGRIAGFSSRGPTDDFRIKPDVVAPGSTITSATTKVGIPTQSMQSASGYTTAGGTSMATPHVAGAAALLRQLHPDWSPFDVKVALMNTARQLYEADGTLYSVMDQGAGLIDVPAALAARGQLYVSRPDLGVGVKEGSHSFGQVESFNGVVTRAVTFTLRDLSGTDRSYSIQFVPGDGKGRGGAGRALPAAGFEASLSASTVVVPAGGEATFTLTVTVDGAVLPMGDYEGRIVAQAADQTLRAPVFYRSVARAAIGSAPTLSAPATAGSSFELSWGTVADAVGYRVEEAATPNATVFSDDAEAGLGNWTTGGLAEDNGVPLNAGWMLSPLRAHGGGQSFKATQGPEQINTLTLATPIDVPAGWGARLAYWSWEDLEPDFDFGYVDVSTDGSTWSTVDTVNGLSGGWVRREVDLSSFSGAPLYVRFRYVSDTAVDLVAHEGWYVDDVELAISDWRSIGETTGSLFTVSGRPSGTWHYRVAALFDTAEARRAQGPYSNAVQVEVRLPDLTVTDVVVAQNRADALIQATVRNAGGSSAREVVVRLLANGAQVGGDVTLSELAAGASATVSMPWSVKGLKGEVQVTALADPANAIAEEREDNNSATRTVTIKGNKVSNGSFEQNGAEGRPSDWSSTGSTGTSSDPQTTTDGQQSVLVTTGGGSWTSAPIAVSAGELLSVSVQATSLGASSAPSLAVSWLGFAGELLGTATVATGAVGSTTSTLAGELSVPPGVTAVKVRLNGFSPLDLAPRGSVGFDDVQVY